MTDKRCLARPREIHPEAHWAVRLAVEESFKQGITVGALAMVADLPTRTIENWYLRGGQPPVDKLEKLLEPLGLYLTTRKN